MSGMEIPIQVGALTVQCAQAVYAFGHSVGNSASGIGITGVSLPPVHNWIRIVRALGPTNLVASSLIRGRD